MGSSLKVGLHNSFIENSDKMLSKEGQANEWDEGRLWDEFQSGSEGAYALIYIRFAGMMYGYGMKLVRDEELIKDCIQDLFVELFNAKHRLGKVRMIKSYLFKSFRRKLLSECKKRRIQRNDFNSNKILKKHITPSFERSLIEKQVFDDQRKKVLLAMEKLTERQREAIHLKFYVLLSYNEISEVMGLTVKGSYKLVARAIDCLKKDMNNF